jgi:ribosomal protein S27E
VTTENSTGGAVPPEDAAPKPEAAKPDVTVLATPQGAGEGVVRCPKCGASDVSIKPKTNTLMCAFCHNEWSEERLDDVMGLSVGIDKLKGTTITTAAAKISDTKALVTLKCTGCGAEVVIDTDHNLQARCHWCKHVLSLNNAIPNGAVPDGILPFTVTRQQAMDSIAAFVDERKTFALPAFSKEFRLENIMGVYLPYMTVDGNLSARLDGVGEVLTGTRRVNDNKDTEYLADSYTVVRTLDLTVDDVEIETEASKANINSEVSTNNIINAILPFDVKNIVRFNSGFLGDTYTSERRDMDVDQAEAFAANHFMTIGRGAVQQSISGYTRGVRWEAEQLHVIGSRWTSVLLPVWLYGFVEIRKGKQITHYIAVNGRSGATMGSVPINRRKAAALAWGLTIGISVITWPLGLIALAAGG